MAIDTNAVTPVATLALIKIDADIERLRSEIANNALAVTGVENAASFLWKAGSKISGLMAAAQFIRDAEKELLAEKIDKTGEGASDNNDRRGPYEN